MTPRALLSASVLILGCFSFSFRNDSVFLGSSVRMVKDAARVGSSSLHGANRIAYGAYPFAFGLASPPFASPSPSRRLAFPRSRPYCPSAERHSILVRSVLSPK